MEKFLQYIEHSKVELTKVIFPTTAQVRQAFIAVIIVVTVVALFLALIDIVMSSSLSAIM